MIQRRSGRLEQRDAFFSRIPGKSQEIHLAVVVRIVGNRAQAAERRPVRRADVGDRAGLHLAGHRAELRAQRFAEGGVRDKAVARRDDAAVHAAVNVRGVLREDAVVLFARGQLGHLRAGHIDVRLRLADRRRVVVVLHGVRRDDEVADLHARADAARHARADDERRRVAQQHGRRAHGGVHLARAALRADDRHAAEPAACEPLAAAHRRLRRFQCGDKPRDFHFHCSDDSDHVGSPLIPESAFQQIVPSAAGSGILNLLQIAVILLYPSLKALADLFAHEFAEALGVALLKAVFCDEVGVLLAEIHIEVFLRLVHPGNLEVRVQVRGLQTGDAEIALVEVVGRLAASHLAVRADHRLGDRGARGGDLVDAVDDARRKQEQNPPRRARQAR